MIDSARVRDSGFGRLPAAVPAATLARLRAEAEELGAVATLTQTVEYELGADGQDFRSPVRFRMACAGDELRGLHESATLRRLATEVADEPMEPTNVGYLYYDAGDRIGLHTDLPACELVLLVALEPVAPPLVVHPELRGVPPDQLRALAEGAEGAPSGGISVPIDDSSFVALFGGGLPHQTRPVSHGEEGVVATLCYVGSRT